MCIIIIRLWNPNFIVIYIFYLNIANIQTVNKLYISLIISYLGFHSRVIISKYRHNCTAKSLIILLNIGSGRTTSWPREDIKVSATVFKNRFKTSYELVLVSFNNISTQIWIPMTFYFWKSTFNKGPKLLFWNQFFHPTLNHSHF